MHTYNTFTFHRLHGGSEMESIFNSHSCVTGCPLLVVLRPGWNLIYGFSESTGVRKSQEKSAA
jgi:hypothetical protein